LSLSIDTYDCRHLETMVDLHNDQTSGQPHIAPLTPQLFTDLVEAKSYFDPAGVFVASEGGEVVGWCHACVAHATETWLNPDPTYARIDMLIYRRQDLHVGTALVAEAVKWLKPTGHDAIHAISGGGGYPFYRGLWMGGERILPTSLPHIHMALGCQGFRIVGDGSLKVGRLDKLPPLVEPRINADFHTGPLHMAHETIRQSWIGFEPMVVKAIVEGAEAGTIGWVILPHQQAKLGAPCVDIYMLGIAPQFQGQGIASALVSRALAAGYHRGARIATVGTQLDNLAAHRTYHKFGLFIQQLGCGRRLDLRPPSPSA